MQRVGIILFSNMRYAPYYQTYRKILDDMGDARYDVIYFNRNPELNEAANNGYIAIPWKKYARIPLAAEKVLNFLHYHRSVTNILREKHYDKVIVLTTIPAVLLSRTLIRNYRQHYILDIRDYTMENHSWFAKREKQAIEASAGCVISSPGFRHFLPEHPYLVCHNMDCHISSNDLQRFTACISDDPVVISYIGTISYIEQCKKLIRLVEQDQRFVLRFYGNEIYGPIISDMVKALGNDRIYMMGSFVPEQKAAIYGASDIVFNCYGNNSMLLQYALSNKLYDGALYKRPLLVSPNTMMAEMSGEFAYAIDLDQEANLNGLYDWYHRIDVHGFSEHAQRLICASIEENRKTEEALISLLSEK